MKFRTGLYICGLTFLLLTGCSNSNVQNDESFKVVATEKSFPSNFSELSYKREEVPYFEYLIQIVHSEDIITDLIQFNEMPNVDHEKEDVLLISHYESGSCPTEIENIEYDNTANLNITLKYSGSICTADATPRTNIILLDKRKSVKALHMEQYTKVKQQLKFRFKNRMEDIII